MGTYGFAQFQIDVRQTDEDLKRAIDDFKRLKTVDKHEEKISTTSKAAVENSKKSEE